MEELFERARESVAQGAESVQRLVDRAADSSLSTLDRVEAEYGALRARARQRGIHPRSFSDNLERQVSTRTRTWVEQFTQNFDAQLPDGLKPLLSPLEKLSKSIVKSAS